MKNISKLLILFFASFLLFGCANKNWNVEVDLTDKERQEIYAQIQNIQAQIKEYDGPEGTIPHLKMINLAREYQKLGDYEKAIDTYKMAQEDGYRVRVFLNNLGKLYEKVGEYDLAIEQYQMMVDEYYDNDYLIDIVGVYLNKGDWRSASEVFNNWQRLTNQTNVRIEQAIKKLREEEKTAEGE